MQFVARGIDTIRVVGIDDKNETLGVLVVVTPERSNLVLTTDIPNGEGNVLVLDGFHVEANGGNGRNDCEKEMGGESEEEERVR